MRCGRPVGCNELCGNLVMRLLRGCYSTAGLQLAPCNMRKRDRPPPLQAKQLRGELEAAQAATGAAAALAAEWRQRAEQYDRDRQAAAANIRWVGEWVGG